MGKRCSSLIFQKLIINKRPIKLNFQHQWRQSQGIHSPILSYLASSWTVVPKWLLLHLMLARQLPVAPQGKETFVRDHIKYQAPQWGYSSLCWLLASAELRDPMPNQGPITGFWYWQSCACLLCVNQAILPKDSIYIWGSISTDSSLEDVPEGCL